MDPILLLDIHNYMLTTVRHGISFYPPTSMSKENVSFKYVEDKDSDDFHYFFFDPIDRSEELKIGFKSIITKYYPSVDAIIPHFSPDYFSLHITYKDEDK
jgi:hypothetical protein